MSISPPSRGRKPRSADPTPPFNVSRAMAHRGSGTRPASRFGCTAMRADLVGDLPGAPVHDGAKTVTPPVQQPPVTAPSSTCEAARRFSGVPQLTESAGRHSGGRQPAGGPGGSLKIISGEGYT